MKYNCRNLFGYGEIVKVNKKSFYTERMPCARRSFSEAWVYLKKFIIIFGIFFQGIIAGLEVRLSPKQYGLNNNSLDFNRSFFEECRAERSERQRQKHYFACKDLT